MFRQLSEAVMAVPGKVFAIDGASSHGAVGIITELKTSWRSLMTFKATLTVVQHSSRLKHFS
jgi:hypothetical protein